MREVFVGLCQGGLRVWIGLVLEQYYYRLARWDWDVGDAKDWFVIVVCDCTSEFTTSTCSK
jgi:hypothetical protein